MGTLLIRDTRLDGSAADVLIENGLFKTIAPHIEARGVRVLEADGKTIVPPFYNMHTHAAMSLLRGYADDMELFQWLREYIWPAEARITAEDVYNGVRLAILEMIRSGTVFFNDMYWHPEAALRAVEAMGVRAALGRLFIEESPGRLNPRNIESNMRLEEAYDSCRERDRIRLTLAPHAIYTVSGVTLRRIAEQANAAEAYIHIHAAETRREVEESLAQHGMTPIAWLDACGILGPRTILAHCVHLTAKDIDIIRERGSTIAHMPVSNAKLASGSFNYRKYVAEGGCRFTIGTDGNASNNSLSMFGEVKAAALLAKQISGDPSCGKDVEMWHAATVAGAGTFGIRGGRIAAGYVADALLLDNDNVFMVPQHHLAANVVYAADSSAVDTVICGGRVLMERRCIPGADEIIAKARESARRIARGG